MNYRKKYLDTDVMQQSICITQLKFEKCTAFLLLKIHCCFPSPPKTMLKIIKLQVLVFKIDIM